MPNTPCITIPDQMPRYDTASDLAKKFCLENLTKDFNSPTGQIIWTCPQPAEQRHCAAEHCDTILTHASMVAPVSSPLKADYRLHEDPHHPTDPCESAASKALDGRFVVDRMTLVFKRGSGPNTWEMRGVHCGDFVWTCSDGTTKICGRMAGVNSTGIVRNPVGLGNNQSLEESCNETMMHGRMFGTICVAGAADPHQLHNAHIDAVYRLYYDPGVGPGKTHMPMGTSGRGLLHGVIIRGCQS